MSTQTKIRRALIVIPINLKNSAFIHVNVPQDYPLTQAQMKAIRKVNKRILRHYQSHGTFFEPVLPEGWFYSKPEQTPSAA